MSLHDPFPAELVNDREFVGMVAHLCRHTGMYVYPVTLTTVLAFLDGYDRGRSAGLLAGLREWMVVRHDGGNNFGWTGLLWQHLHGGEVPQDDKEGQGKLIQGLGELLREFFEYRRKVGLTKLYYDYGEWLLHQDWYEGPLRRKD